MYLFCHNRNFNQSFYPQRMVFLEPDETNIGPVSSFNEGIFKARSAMETVLDDAKKQYESGKPFDPDLLRGSRKKLLESIVPKLQASLTQSNIPFDSNNPEVVYLQGEIKKARVTIDKYYQNYMERMTKNSNEALETAKFYTGVKIADGMCNKVNALSEHFYQSNWTLNDSPEKVIAECEEDVRRTANELESLKTMSQNITFKVGNNGIFLNIVTEAKATVGKLSDKFKATEEKFNNGRAIMNQINKLHELEEKMVKYPDDENLRREYVTFKRDIDERRRKYGVNANEEDGKTPISAIPPIEVDSKDSGANGKNKRSGQKELENGKNNQQKTQETGNKSSEDDQKGSEEPSIVVDKKRQERVSSDQIPEIIITRTLARAQRKGPNIIINVDGQTITLIPDPNVPATGKSKLYIMEGYPKGYPANQANEDQKDFRTHGKPLRLAVAQAIAYVSNLKREKRQNN